MAGATASGTILAASDLSGIYRSYDNGAHWDVLGANNGLQDTHISALGFHGTDGNTFFVGTGSGLYKTTNAGNTLALVLPNATNPDVEYIESIAASQSSPNVVYATQHLWQSTPSNIYKSTDGGTTWSIVAGIGLPANQHMIKLLVHPANASIVYVLTGKSRWGCSPARLYRSHNGGNNWTQIATTLPDQPSVLPPNAAEPAELSILDMDIDPTNTDIVFVSTFHANPCPTQVTEDYEYVGGSEYAGAFYKSTNSGASFSWLTDKTGIISVGTRDQTIIRLVDILYPYDWFDDAGTWESTDGGQNWAHTGFVSNWFTGHSNNQYFSYSVSFNGLSKTLTKDIFNSDRMYASFGQWVWATFDGGVHLNNISTQEVGASSGRWLSTGMENINGHVLEVSDANSDVVYMGGYDIGFWYSIDHGASWKRTQPNYNIYHEYVWNIADVSDLPVDQALAVTGEGANISTLLSDPDREAVVWASFSRGQYSDVTEGIVSKTGLFKSTNYGENWQWSGNGLPTGAVSIRLYGLSVDNNSPVNNRRLYMTVKGDVYKSTDDGQNWLLVLANGGLKFTEVDKFDSDIVYAGGKNGLWRSLDEGNSWTPVTNPALKANPASLPVREDIVPTFGYTYLSSAVEITVLPWEGVFDIQTDPNIPNRVYVTVLGAGKGLYRSDNAGASWTKLITNDHMRGVAISPRNSSVLYATGSESYHSGGSSNSLGIVYSTDEGASWQDANDGMAWDYGGMIEVENEVTPSVWAWSPGTGVQHSPVNLCETALNLAQNKWAQISLSCSLPAGSTTVQAVFGDDLSGTYDTDWMVYSYNSATNTYTNIGLNGILTQGTGYWIIQLNTNTARLDLPQGSTPILVTQSNQCASTSGCYSLPLATKPAAVQWNMLGHIFPYTIAFNRLRIVTNSGLCASGCTLDQAKSENIVENTFWYFDGLSYKLIQNNNNLVSWTGFWIATLAGANGLNPVLQIPQD